MVSWKGLVGIESRATLVPRGLPKLLAALGPADFTRDVFGGGTQDRMEDRRPNFG